MSKLQDYTMRVFVKDRRYKVGERLCARGIYEQKHDQWMAEEVRDLQAGLYPAPKYRIEVEPAYVAVRNLMTGQEVKIRTEDRGGVCDPSTERYWSA